MMKILFIFIMLLITPGSVNAQEIFKGHYVGAFERKIFFPCGTDEMWWFRAEKNAVNSEIEVYIEKNALRSGKSAMKPNTPVYIDVRGTKSAKGNWGHRGLYDYQLSVTEIINISVIDKCAKTPAQPGITTTVKKTDKQIQLTVCNKSENGDFKYYDVHVEQQVDDRWGYVRHYMGCPCNAKCRRKKTKLAPGECATHRWDKKKSDCNNAENGRYRFVIRGEDDPEIIVKSCELEIH